MNKSFSTVIGLGEVSKTTTWCPGRKIWSATSPSCPSCSGADRGCLVVWPSTQGGLWRGRSFLDKPARISICQAQQKREQILRRKCCLVLPANNYLRFAPVSFLIQQVCRWSLCCVGFAGVYGLSLLHYIQASWNCRIISMYQSCSETDRKIYIFSCLPFCI